MSTIAGVDGLEITGPVGDRFDEVPTPRALGSGAVGINNLMEDAATAEISRSQVWQWLHNKVQLSNGETVTRELVERITDEEMEAIAEARGDSFASGRWDDARALFLEMAVSDEYSDFLTLPAYERMP
jgi:malate synthase